MGGIPKMEITARIRPKSTKISTKIIAMLDNYDFTEGAIHQFVKLYQSNQLPCLIEGTEDGDILLHNNNYPVEKLREESITIHGNDNPAVREIDNLIFVVKSLVRKIGSGVDELQGVPLEININMDSWLSKSIGFYKEIDDTD